MKSQDELGTVYWVTGLAGSGKTTIGNLLAQELRKKGRPVVFLDGDELREVFGNDLGHTLADRKNSAMRNSRLCRMLSAQKVDVVCSTISMFNECREWNRSNIPNYREIYLRVPIEILAKRHPKDLYQKAIRGEISNVWGIDLPWEEPQKPDCLIDNIGDQDPSYLVEKIIREVSVNKNQIGASRSYEAYHQ